MDDKGLAIKWEKRTFLTHNLELLGLQIDAKGTNPLIHKSEAIRNLNKPRCIKDKRSLLGSVNQFNKFIPMQKSNNFISLRRTFRRSKEMNNTVTNHLFDINLKTRLKCSASHLGMGASVDQDHREIWKSLAFASRFPRIAELKYSTNELELLVLLWALDNFKNTC